MKASNVIIGLIFVSLIVLSAAMIMKDYENDYGVDMDTERFNATYNKMSDVQEKTEGMKDAVESTDVSTLEAASFFISGAWSVLTLVLQSIPLINSMLLSFAMDYGIPPWFMYGITTAIMATIIFVIISIIFRRET